MAKIPFYKTLKNSHLLRLGVPKKIEQWMLGNRGRRFPSANFARAHGIALSSVTNLAARISQHHGLPVRPKGGPNATRKNRALKALQTASVKY